MKSTRKVYLGREPNNREGTKRIARINEKAASIQIAISRSGSESSQTKGNRMSATRAMGQQKKSSTHQPITSKRILITLRFRCVIPGGQKRKHVFGRNEGRNWARDSSGTYVRCYKVISSFLPRDAPAVLSPQAAGRLPARTFWRVSPGSRVRKHGNHGRATSPSPFRPRCSAASE
jgi:hypothetical protein